MASSWVGAQGSNRGLAISPDEAWMAITHGGSHIYSVSVFSLPLQRCKRSVTVGTKGRGKGQFDGPMRVCFTPAGTILVAEWGNKRIQEILVTGEHVGFIGYGVIDDSICGIAADDKFVVATKCGNTSGNRVLLFDAKSGHLVTQFGEYGSAPGQLMRNCTGVRILPGSGHVIISEDNYAGVGRLSVFTINGEFVKVVSKLAELQGSSDVEVLADGEIAAIDVYKSVATQTHRVCVYSAGDGGLRLGIGHNSSTKDPLTFFSPQALAYCRASGRLYVLDDYSVAYSYIYALQ